VCFLFCILLNDYFIMSPADLLHGTTKGERRTVTSNGVCGLCAPCHRFERHADIFNVLKDNAADRRLHETLEGALQCHIELMGATRA